MTDLLLYLLVMLILSSFVWMIANWYRTEVLLRKYKKRVKMYEAMHETLRSVQESSWKMRNDWNHFLEKHYPELSIRYGFERESDYEKYLDAVEQIKKNFEVKPESFHQACAELSALAKKSENLEAKSTQASKEELDEAAKKLDEIMTKTKVSFKTAKDFENEASSQEKDHPGLTIEVKGLHLKPLIYTGENILPGAADEPFNRKEVNND